MANPQAPGLVNSLRSLGPALLSLLRTRLELFGVELAEEKSRIVTLAALGVAGAVCAAMALLLVNFLFIAFFWEQRIAAVLALLTVYGIAAFALLHTLKSKLGAHPMVFEGTVDELKKDLTALRGQSEGGQG